MQGQFAIVRIIFYITKAQLRVFTICCVISNNSSHCVAMYLPDIKKYTRCVLPHITFIKHSQLLHHAFNLHASIRHTNLPFIKSLTQNTYIQINRRFLLPQDNNIYTSLDFVPNLLSPSYTKRKQHKFTKLWVPGTHASKMPFSRILLSYKSSNAPTHFNMALRTPEQQFHSISLVYTIDTTLTYGIFNLFRLSKSFSKTCFTLLSPAAKT